MKFDILNRFTGAVQFTAEIDCKEDESTSIKIGLAVKWAVKTSADLRSADLRYANLSYADLSSANLRYADLRSADLSSANLSSADLRSAKTDKRYIQVSCIGSRKDMTTYCFEDDLIICGCFKGTLKEFKEKVLETYPDKKSQYHKEYLGFIKYLEGLK